MARKQSSPHGPGSLNEQNRKAWINFLNERVEGQTTRGRIAVLFAEFKASPFYKMPSRPPPLPARLRPWDNSEILHRLAIELAEEIRALRLDNLASSSAMLPFIPCVEIREIVSACMSCLEDSHLSPEGIRRLHEFLSAVRKAALHRGSRAWTAIGNEAYFKWPSTDVFDARLWSMIDATDWEKEGPLKLMGYTVGLSSALSRSQRESLLRATFESNITAYVSALGDEWGVPSSPKRLRKMAYSIAAFARSAQRNNRGDYRQAVSDWERDLKFLYSQYYQPMFRIYNFSPEFEWPEINGT